MISGIPDNSILGAITNVVQHVTCIGELQDQRAEVRNKRYLLSKKNIVLRSKVNTARVIDLMDGNMKK